MSGRANMPHLPPQYYLIGLLAIAFVLAMFRGAFRLWVGRRFSTFDLLFDYGKAVQASFLDVLWGVGVGATVPYIVFGLYSLFKTPTPLVNWLAIVGALFLAGYYLWRADHLRLTPQLEITRVIPQSFLNPLSRRQEILYDFDVVNKSEVVTIEWVRVELIEIAPVIEEITWLPVPLRQKHDHAFPTHAKQDFNLNPGQRRSIDFVQAAIGGDRIVIHHLVAGAMDKMDAATRYRLKVAVTAKNTAGCTAWFDVWIDQEGVLQCEMEQKPKSSTQ